MTTVPSLTEPLPNTSTMTESQYNAAWNTLLTEMNPWGQAINTVSIEINDAKIAAAASETAAATSAADAASSSALSAANANFKGVWSTLTGAANIPYSVEHSGNVYILLSNLADVTTKTPGVDPEWLLINKPLTRAQVTARSLYF